MTDASTPPELSYRRRRSGNIFAQIQMLLLRPVTFFKGLQPMGETRQWLLVILLILGLVGYSAVRQAADFGFDGTFTSGTLSDQLIIALTASAPMVGAWLALMFLIGAVSMLKGHAPQFGKNLQVAIWSSVPFGLMAAIQILYMLAGEFIVDAGIIPVMSELGTQEVWGETVHILLLNIYTHVTIFGVWHLILLYLGGRYTLNGTRWAVILVIVVWVLAVILLPTAYDILSLPPNAVDTFTPLS